MEDAGTYSINLDVKQIKDRYFNICEKDFRRSLKPNLPFCTNVNGLNEIICPSECKMHKGA